MLAKISSRPSFHFTTVIVKAAIVAKMVPTKMMKRRKNKTLKNTRPETNILVISIKEYGGPRTSVASLTLVYKKSFGTRL